MVIHGGGEVEDGTEEHHQLKGHWGYWRVGYTRIAVEEGGNQGGEGVQ